MNVKHTQKSLPLLTGVPFARVVNSPLVAALVLAPLFMVFSLGGAEAFGLSRATLASGEWFTLFTFMFAHENGMHLLFNFAALALAGVIGMETKLSGPKLALIFLATGFAIVPVVFLIPTPYVFMGASAGIYGILGAEAVELKRYGLSPVEFFFLFAIAAIADLLSTSPTAVLQVGLHLAGLSLGSAIVLIQKFASGRRSNCRL